MNIESILIELLLPTPPRPGSWPLPWYSPSERVGELGSPIWHSQSERVGELGSPMVLAELACWEVALPLVLAELAPANFLGVGPLMLKLNTIMNQNE